MKKIIATAFIVCSLMGCGDDDKPVEQVKQDDTKKELIGKWKMIKAEYYKDGVLVETEDLKSGSCDFDYYDLKTDGTKDEIYHDKEADCAIENNIGTWIYNSSNKTVTIKDNEDDSTFIVTVASINATDLKIKLVTTDGVSLPNGLEAYMYLNK